MAPAGLWRVWLGWGGMAAAGPLVASVLLQVTVVTGAALICVRLLGPGRSQWRYVISLSALLCVLLSPVLTGLAARTGGLPIPAPFHVRIPVPSLLRPHGTPPRGRFPSSPEVESGAADVAIAAPARADTLHQPALPALPPLLPALLLVVWAGGGLVHLARLCHGWREARGLLRDAVPLAEAGAGDRPAVLGQVRQALGVKALPSVLVSPLAPMPLVVGIRRPSVLLPARLAERLPPGQLRAVLIHECAHVAQGHPWSGLAQRVALLLFWPHPLVHILVRSLARAREEVCDNFVLRSMAAPAYARTLLRIAVGTPPLLCETAQMGLLPARWRLEDRIAGLLDPYRGRATRVGRGWSAAAAALLLAVGALTAALRLAPAQDLARRAALTSLSDAARARLALPSGRRVAPPGAREAVAIRVATPTTIYGGNRQSDQVAPRATTSGRAEAGGRVMLARAQPTPRKVFNSGGVPSPARPGPAGTTVNSSKTARREPLPAVAPTVVVEPPRRPVYTAIAGVAASDSFPGGEPAVKSAERTGLSSESAQGAAAVPDDDPRVGGLPATSAEAAKPGPVRVGDGAAPATERASGSGSARLPPDFSRPAPAERAAFEKRSPFPWFTSTTPPDRWETSQSAPPRPVLMAVVPPPTAQTTP